MKKYIREIADSFDARADTYVQNEWHKNCAKRLVVLCQLQPGYHVLDVATGTGFAALAAAQAVGSHGHVQGIDISPGMLRQARKAVTESGLTNLQMVEGDALHLPQYEPETFDVIMCAAGLLYMPVGEALLEWHRLLKKGGLIAFSTMKAGSPLAGRIFRDCAATFGIKLRDPSEPLGSISACRLALEEAGFEGTDIVSETIEFSAQDLTLAWESNFRSAGHKEIWDLSPQDQGKLKDLYLASLAREELENPGSLRRAEVLYALGRR